jgi:TolB-like protein
MIRGITVMLLALAGWLAPVSAQDRTLEEAVAAYRTGDYDGCIAVAADLAERWDVAKRMDEEAREAIQKLLELEPPLVALDADVEPPPLMSIYLDVRRNIQGSYEVERPHPGFKTIAIMGFSNNSIDQRGRFDALQWGLASMMITQLSGATDLKVVERERLQWLLNELDLQSSPERVDQATAVRMGKLLGASAILLGGFIVQGSRMRIDARLVNVETGEVLMGEEITGRHRRFFDLAERLSLRVAQAINVTLSRTEVGARTETKSLDAMLSYSEGIALLEKEAYRQAYEKFLEALNYDPSYARARVKAESIRPLLAAG